MTAGGLNALVEIFSFIIAVVEFDEGGARRQLFQFKVIVAINNFLPGNERLSRIILRPLPLRMQIPQSPAQRPRHARPLMGNIQLAINLHAASVDIGRAMGGEHVIHDHQLGVDVHLRPFFT